MHSKSTDTKQLFTHHVPENNKRHFPLFSCTASPIPSSLMSFMVVSVLHGANVLHANLLLDCPLPHLLQVRDIFGLF